MGRERAAHSCPASKLCPGVDDVVVGLTDLQTKESVLFSGEMPSKNTFVHFPVQHISLDASEERRTKSCPSSGVEMADGLGQVHEQSTTFQNGDIPVSVVETPLSFGPFADFCMDNMQADLYFPGAAMPMDEQFVQMMWVGVETSQIGVETSQTSRPVLSLAEALPEPEIGSPEMPSVGSIGHWNGTCKPCAFMARGCTSGVNCPFCHLCDVNEKKRRRKDKIAFMRELRRWKKEQAAGASADQHM